MSDSSREAHIEKINKAKAEMKTAGPCHRRDIARSIKRMKKELIIYDKYHKQAVMRSG